MTKRIVVLSDMQIPLHDREVIKRVIKFVKEYEPDEIYCVGDEADCLAPARWSKGYAAEFSNFQRDLDETTAIMTKFRDALGDKPFHLMRSNHGDRLPRYAAKYAPALSTLRDLQYDKLLGYRDLEIVYHKQLWNFAPGWIMGHGDEGGSSTYAGGTAMSLAKKTGMSVLCGHTHKLGLLHFNTSYNGKLTSSLHGFEVGNMMDLKKATYLEGGSANWQSGFGLLYIDRGKVTPVAVPILGNSFVVEGEAYKW
ncbi:MAG: metallophosphoesterase [Candidatus Nanopelagicales bacterium]